MVWKPAPRMLDVNRSESFIKRTSKKNEVAGIHFMSFESKFEKYSLFFLFGRRSDHFACTNGGRRGSPGRSKLCNNWWVCSWRSTASFDCSSGDQKMSLQKQHIFRNYGEMECWYGFWDVLEEVRTFYIWWQISKWKFALERKNLRQLLGLPVVSVLYSYTQ